MQFADDCVSFVSQAQKRGQTSETLIVDAFIKIPFLGVLGASEMTMTWMVNIIVDFDNS